MLELQYQSKVDESITILHIHSQYKADFVVKYLHHFQIIHDNHTQEVFQYKSHRFICLLDVPKDFNNFGWKVYLLHDINLIMEKLLNVNLEILIRDHDVSSHIENRQYTEWAQDFVNIGIYEETCEQGARTALKMLHHLMRHNISECLNVMQILLTNHNWAKWINDELHSIRITEGHSCSDGH
jgi:hypothetical protein